MDVSNRCSTMCRRRRDVRGYRECRRQKGVISPPPRTPQVQQRRYEQNADDASTTSELEPATQEHRVVHRHHEEVLHVLVARLQQRGQRGRRGTAGRKSAHPQWRHTNRRSRHPQTSSASESAQSDPAVTSAVEKTKRRSRQHGAATVTASVFSRRGWWWWWARWWWAAW